MTADLAEGPVIEQETARVHHALSAGDYDTVRRDTESRVRARARAMRLDLPRRVLPNGHKTGVVIPGRPTDRAPVARLQNGYL